jgi:hypothetical protein
VVVIVKLLVPMLVKARVVQVTVTAIRNDTDNWVEVKNSDPEPSTTVPVQNIEGEAILPSSVD